MPLLSDVLNEMPVVYILLSVVNSLLMILWAQIVSNLLTIFQKPMNSQLATI